METSFETTFFPTDSILNNLTTTKVLLVIIKNDNQNNLTQKLLFDLFSQYGNPLKILIFEKKLKWKAFVEMDTIESAYISREKLNNMKIFPDGTEMNLYFSDHEKISFQKVNNDGYDYTQSQKKATTDNSLEKESLGKKKNSTSPSQSSLLQKESTFFATTEENNHFTNSLMNSSEPYFCSPLKINQIDIPHNESKIVNLQEKKKIKLMITSAPFDSSKLKSDETTNYSSLYKDQQFNFTQKDNNQNQSKIPSLKTPNLNPEKNANANNILINKPSKSFNDILYNPSNLNLIGRAHSTSFNMQEYDVLSDTIGQKKKNIFNVCVDEIIAKEDSSDIDRASETIISRTQSPHKSCNDQMRKSSKLPNIKNQEENDDILNIFNKSNKNNYQQKENNDNFTSYQDLLEDNDNYDKVFVCNKFPIIQKKTARSSESSNNLNDSFHSNSNKRNVNNKFKTDFDILYNEEEKINEKKLSKKKEILEGIESEIKKIADNNFDTTIKNIEDMIKIENKIEPIPINNILHNNSFNSFSENSALTPINFLTQNMYLHSFYNTPSPNSNFESFFCSEIENNPMNQYSENNNKKSKVIYVRGLENEIITINMIYNLFSNFGNILKIMFLKKKSVALIDFENIGNASNTRENLNNIIFFGSTLKIFYSNYSEINLKNQESLPDEVFIGSEETNRFKKNRSISINPPSNILHVSNLKKDVCTYDIIMGLFNNYGKVESVKFMVMDHYKNMCLVKYKTIEQSIIALCYLHGNDIMGRKMQISFTRTKI